jgi:beta-N-acetylhexosaminidase
MSSMRNIPPLAALLIGAVLSTAQPSKPSATVQRQPGIVQQWMRHMTLEDRVAQLISMPCYGENPSTRSEDYRKFRHWVRDLHIGGLIVANRVTNGTVRNAEPYAMAVFLNRMQRMARVPLLVSSDFERGASMRVADTVRFPHNMAFGATGDYEASRFEGAETARQARALGVQWIFAPDADVNNNPDNPIINIRSYGEDPLSVSRHVTAYIEGAQSDPANRVLVTVKHFPGHGDTAVDTHLGLARLDVPKERLEAVEWVPFRAAIEHGVDAVMTAHIAVPAIEPEPIPSTISAKVLTGVLRGELGFKGLIVTDAMDMQGLAAQYSAGEASVRALEAGADVLLMPRDADEAIRAVVRAVKQGRLTRKRIDQSVARVLAAKVRVGLAHKRLVDLDSIDDVIDSPEVAQRAQSVADRAVTLVRNNGDIVPLRAPERSCLFVLLESRYTQQGRQLTLELRRRAPQMRVRILDPTSPASELQDSLQMAAGCDAAAAAAWVTSAAYRGNIALPEPLSGFVTSLTEARPAALISFGNPYLLRSYPKSAAYLAAFSTVPPSETAMVKALLGAIPITGRMPVTIPGFAGIGDGIQLTTTPSSR